MDALTLLQPKGLALLGLLAPLVLLYVLRMRRKRLVVPSTWLFARARRDLMARSPFQRLVPQVPLVLEALAIGALAVAFARPVSRSAAALGDHIAVVVDVSASMSADEKAGSKTSRLDAAKRAARDLVGSLPRGAEVMIVAAGREANVASPLDRDRERTLSAIDALSVEEVEGDLAPSVGLASERLSRYARARIVVFTDGALAHPTTLEGGAIPVEVSVVGEPVDNVGITRVDVRAGLDPATKTDEVRAFVVLSSSARAPRDVFVTMREDNASDVLASRRVLVEPGKKLPVELTFVPSQGDRGRGLVFDVSPHDAMPLDDVAYGRVPTTDRLPVALASTSSPPPVWLERALASDPRVELSRGGVADLAGASLDPGALVVIDGACPREVDGGDLLVVHPPKGDCRGVGVGDAVDAPAITSQSPTDPRLRFVTFDGVSIAEANRLAVDDASRVLVRSRETPLVVDASTPGRTVTIVGFDVGESDWPLKASFVLFVRDVLEEARSHRANSVVGAARTGSPLVIPVPATSRIAEVTTPRGRPEPVAPKGGLVVIPSVTRAGLYRVTLDAPAKRTLVVPVSLASEAESDLSRTIAPRSAGGVTVRAAGEAPKTFGDHAWLLALLALALVAADVAWLTRRPRASTLARPRSP